MTRRLALSLALALPLAWPTVATRGDEPREATLESVSFETFKARVAANPSKAKYTLVDAWATFCPPCKENFPHLVKMHKELGPRGLAVASVTLDDPRSGKTLDQALAFLKEQEQGEPFPNYAITGGSTAGFDGFDITAIPAVFLYGPDGKEIKRFTLDDPDNQFTYDEVEAVVRALLDGKPLPEDNCKPKS